MGGVKQQMFFNTVSFVYTKKNVETFVVSYIFFSIIFFKKNNICFRKGEVWVWFFSSWGKSDQFAFKPHRFYECGKP